MPESIALFGFDSENEKVESDNKNLIVRVANLEKEKIENTKLLSQKDASIFGIIQNNINIIAALRQHIAELKNK